MNLMNLFLKTQLSNLQNSKLNLDYFLSEYCRIKNNLGIFDKQENPHLLMKKNISEVLKIDLDLIGIKATTNEKLGAEGREEGISCHSVVLLEKKEENEI